jgi:hypothetical protein
VVSTVAQIRLPNLDPDCSRRPAPFSLPGVPSTLQEAMGAGDVLEGRQAGTCPARTNASPTTLFVYARLHTGLAWISGIALPRLLPHDL